MLTGDLRPQRSAREILPAVPCKTSSAKLSARQSLESVDYDLHESRQYVEYVQSWTLQQTKVKAAYRWLYTGLVGAGAGVVAVTISFVLHHVSSAKFDVQQHLFDAGHGLWFRYLVWLLTSMVLVSVAGVLVCYVEPLAGGSGIPEIKCILNGVDLPNVLRRRTLACKAFGIVCSVAAGLPCGKEGPMIHSGAIVGAQAARADAGPFVGAFRQNAEARDFVAAGAAAGVAAAFGAPIGGVLFAVEEGASHMNPRILVRTFVCAAVATLTVRFFAGPMDHATDWGVMGTEVPVEFGRFAVRKYRVWELIVFALIGIAGGLAGALFNALNTHLSHWRMRVIGPRGHLRFLEVLVVTASIVSFNFFAPTWFGTDEMSTYGNSERLFVEFGGKAITALFHEESHFDQGILLFFCVVHYAQTVWTYGLGVPSGLFVPSLLGGAAFGRSIGQVMQALESTATNPGVYALIGATAMLSGMARITISLAVILMETTGEAEWGLPIFLTVMAAKWTGDLFGKGIYDIHIDLRHVPVLEVKPHKNMLTVQAGDIMAKHVVAVKASESVGRLMKVLDACTHSAFPVIDPNTRRFLGLLQRSTLHQVLLLGKAQRRLPDAGLDDDIVSYDEMVRNRHPKFPGMHELRAAIEPEDFGKVLDLLPYTNRGAFIVQEQAAATRCHLLFRTMGLRHLPVLGEDHTVRGIITRKDLIAALETHGFGGTVGARGKDADLDVASPCATIVAAPSKSASFKEDGDPAEMALMSPSSPVPSMAEGRDEDCKDMQENMSSDSFCFRV